MSVEELSEVLHPRTVAEGELFDAGLKRTLARLTRFNRWMIVVGVALAAALELGTQIAVNIILQDMKGNVAASQDELSWIVTAYSAAFLCAVPLATRLVRRLGHRNHLVLSLLVYGAGAFPRVPSANPPPPPPARFTRGPGGGASLVPALVAVNRPHTPQERGPASLVLWLINQSSRALIPLLCGVVTDHGRWNLAFLALVP